MDSKNPARVVRRVREKLEVSQEGLARLLNATKGAVQHWERGRNNPDLARLNALRQLCPRGPERRELDELVKQTQARLAPMPVLKPGASSKVGAAQGAKSVPADYPARSFVLLRREHHRLQRQVAKLEGALRRREEKLRILEDLASELLREKATLRAGVPLPTAKAASAVGTG